MNHKRFFYLVRPNEKIGWFPVPYDTLPKDVIGILEICSSLSKNTFKFYFENIATCENYFLCKTLPTQFDPETNGTRNHYIPLFGLKVWHNLFSIGIVMGTKLTLWLLLSN
jgi:hypothetical protein